MKRILFTLLVLFSLSCEREEEPISLDGSWVGYLYIGQWKFVIEFDITTEANAVFGYMVYYQDTMQIIEPSYFNSDSVIMYVDYIMDDVEFRFDGKIKHDGNIIDGKYFIEGASGPRKEPFEIYKQIE